MVKLADLPAGMKPFVFHGVNLTHSGTATQAQGDCPFCTKEGKLYVNVEKGLWDCKSCGAKGNPTEFIRQLWQDSDTATDADQLIDFMTDRGLLLPETPIEWGVCRSLLTGEWLVPGYGVNGALNHLYRYAELRLKPGAGVVKRLMATPETPHQLYGANLYDKRKSTVYICEGPWDGMALWEVMRSAKWDSDRGSGGGLMLTNNPLTSLASDANVLAVPSASTFNPAWAALCAGKRVVLMYDNDHPRKHPTTGKEIPPAGLTGMRRVAEKLAVAETPPAEINYLQWGKGGYDLTRKDGYDVRDALRDGGDTMEGRVAALHSLLHAVKPIPEDWVPGRSPTAKAKGGTEILAEPCDAWTKLVTQWRKSMSWTEGLDRALSVMLACISSTRAVGDQLWFKIIGPPACGKSTLCEALSTNRVYTKPLSTFRGFTSGYKSKGGDSDEDNSLITQLKDKTLVTKDGDTLLQTPNRDQVLSEARDIYDRQFRTSYRNATERDYENINMTWLLCGTSALRALDHSELGARFLDCVIMEGIDDELEDEVLDRQLHKAIRGAGIAINGKSESQFTPDVAKTMAMTAGYINWLRDGDNAINLTGAVTWDEGMLELMKSIAKFVSYMRARPSTKQDETVERELGSRLLGQHVKLALFLAVVLNRGAIDHEVMRRVRQVALDTARGWTLKIVGVLYEHQEDGVDARGMSVIIGNTDEKTAGLLRFLQRLGAVEVYRHRAAPGLPAQKRYRLTDKLRVLYEQVALNG